MVRTTRKHKVFGFGPDVTLPIATKSKLFAVANVRYFWRLALHLLLTDVVMPGMNGRVLAEALVAERPELRVLYMSGYTDDVIAHRGVLEPGTMLLEKPFGARGLLGRVRESLGARGPGGDS